MSYVLSQFEMLTCEVLGSSHALLAKGCLRTETVIRQSRDTTQTFVLIHSTVLLN